MPSATAITILTLTFLLIPAALFYYRDTTIPLAIYIKTYVLEGKEAAESAALEEFGENKLSYMTKSTLKDKDTVPVDDPTVNQVQEGVGETVGGALDDDKGVGQLGKGAGGKGGVGGLLNEGVGGGQIGMGGVAEEGEKKQGAKKEGGLLGGGGLL